MYFGQMPMQGEMFSHRPPEHAPFNKAGDKLNGGIYVS